MCVVILNGIMVRNIILCFYADCVMMSDITLNFILSYVDCYYVECHFAKYHFSKCTNAQCTFVMCHCPDWYYVKDHCAVIMLCVITLSEIMLSVIMLGVITLSVILLCHYG
jgi:hypothetical protein